MPRHPEFEKFIGSLLVGMVLKKEENSTMLGLKNMVLMAQKVLVVKNISLVKVLSG
jgi:hypothetical protein